MNKLDMARVIAKAVYDIERLPPANDKRVMKIADLPREAVLDCYQSSVILLELQTR